MNRIKFCKLRLGLGRQTTDNSKPQSQLTYVFVLSFMLTVCWANLQLVLIYYESATIWVFFYIFLALSANI
jgi:hypothetical protein